MDIRIEDRDLIRMIGECADRIMIAESQESDSQHKAIALAMQYGMDKERANYFVRNELRNDMTSLRDKRGGKFTLGVARMYFEGDLVDAQTINRLNRTLKILSSAHYNEYDKNLNGMSAMEVIDRFSSSMNDMDKRDREEIDAEEYNGESSYRIVPINSFEEAEYYHDYTYKESPWCLTYMEDMFQSYTAGGINQIYFCLMDGFETMEPTVGENCPLDDYGLSMISVIVDGDGNLAYATCRWNHENGGNDSVLDTKSISRIMNVNFYSTFKPNHMWEDTMKDVKKKFESGISVSEIFQNSREAGEGLYAVSIADRWNFINKNGNFISDQWFDYVDDFQEGFAIVMKNYKRNWMDLQGNILSKIWFDYVGPFCEGYAQASNNGVANWIGKDGNMFSETRYSDTGDFIDGVAIVRMNGKTNMIDKNEKILFDTWYDWMSVFINGLSEVTKNNKANLTDRQGNLFSDIWFDNITRETTPNIFRVRIGEKFNILGYNGKVLFDEWFCYIEHENTGKFIVGRYRKNKTKEQSAYEYNVAKIDGTFVSDTWLDKIYPEYEGFYKICKDRLWNVMDTKGNIILGQWVDTIGSIRHGKVKFVGDDGEIYTKSLLDNGKPYKEIEI